MRASRGVVQASLGVFLVAAGGLIAAQPASASGSRAVSLTATTTTITEGDSAVVTLTLTGAPATSDVIVNLKTVDGTAKAGSDYTALNTSVRFHPGDQTPKTVSVATTKDLAPEGNEYFSVTIASTRNASVMNRNVNFTLTDFVPTPAPFSCQVRPRADELLWLIPPVAGATSYDLTMSSDTTGAVRSISVIIPASAADPTQGYDIRFALIDANFANNNGQLFHGSMHTVVNGVATDASAQCYYVVPSV
jgi:hypothetical protein